MLLINQTNIHIYIYILKLENIIICMTSNYIGVYSDIYI